MPDLSQLLNTEEPGIEKIREWMRGAANQCILLPPSADRERVLLQMQVTTRSTMGAIAYETGGVIVDGGWLRFLGSGHPSLTQTLLAWNEGRSRGFYLVADDAIGGFFAINGGAFGEDGQNMYYWAPDSLDWEPLKIGFTDFFVWALSDRLAQFYRSLRWASWREDTADLSGDKAITLLDTASVWLLIRSLGATASALGVSASFAIATLFRTLGVLPGGLGSFEAASVLTLQMIGVTLPVALSATHLFRGLSFWLPMIPGLWFSRRAARRRVRPGSQDQSAA